MKKHISILKQTQLFTGINEDEIAAMLECLQARIRTYEKGEYVFRQGEYLTDIAVLAEGRLYIQREDFWGNHSIVQNIEAGEIFGEAYIAPGSGAVLNDVAAIEKSTVIFCDVSKILTVCSSACRFHVAVVQNLFYSISEKNRKLVQKLGHMSKRTTREKLMSYLSDEAKRQGSHRITIPFNRQQLADFLSVDRSAMSKELCKMRDDGLIVFEKNRFILQ